MNTMMRRFVHWLQYRAEDPGRWRLQRGPRWWVQMEFQPADLCVGVFWRRSWRPDRLDIWICLLPTLPLHLVRLGPEVGR